MTPIYHGRFTAHTDEPFVIFMIGMRINKLRAVRKWWPVTQAMTKMLQTLHEDPEKGLLGMTSWVGWRETMLVQYWRSYEHLERFARSKDDPHVDAWRAFNQAVGADGTVGIFHETYLVDPGKFETIYGNMPRKGLPAAMEHLPATGRRETARRRLGGVNESAVPSPEQPLAS